MQLSISVPGEFHAFHLARQMERRDALGRIVTSYPASKVDSHGIPDDKIHSVYPIEVLSVLREITPVTRVRGLDTRLVHLRNELFDRLIERYLDWTETDVFIGYAGACYNSLVQANEAGCTTIVERASSHIRTQAHIVDSEYEKLGLDSPISDDIDKHARRNEREYKEADYVITPSQFAYDSFLDNGVPEENVLLVPFGVDPTAYNPSYVSDDTVRFLFAGNVGFRKGVHYLLRAWDRCTSPNAELVIAGSIEENNILKPYRTDDSVRVLGWTDDIADWYRRSDVFVFPTLEEGSAYVTYEAMASGLPLITTSHSGWVGIDGEHGVEVPIRDEDALQEAIEYLYSNEETRRSMGQNARKLVESEYTWDDYGRRVNSKLTAVAPDTVSTER